jgi:hypothetical protein
MGEMALNKSPLQMCHVCDTCISVDVQYIFWAVYLSTLSLPPSPRVGSVHQLPEVRLSEESLLPPPPPPPRPPTPSLHYRPHIPGAPSLIHSTYFGPMKEGELYKILHRHYLFLISQLSLSNQTTIWLLKIKLHMLIKNLFI